jgi:hypothetical protein
MSSHPGETLGDSQDTKHRCLFWRWSVERADHAGVRLAGVCLTGVRLTKEL